MYNERGCHAKVCALVVLIFWPNLKLAVLIELVLIKKACILIILFFYSLCWNRDLIIKNDRPKTPWHLVDSNVIIVVLVHFVV